MASDNTLPAVVTLEECVAAFEAAQALDGRAALNEFVPAPTHPDYARVVRELARIDLEFGWGRGRPRGLHEYCREFPEVFLDLQALGEIAFEEYRQRREHGENPSPREYQVRYGVDTEGWPHEDDSAFTSRRQDEGPAAPADAGGLLRLEKTQQVEIDFAVEKAARAYQALSLRRLRGEDGDLDSAGASCRVPDTAFDPEKARRLAGTVANLPEVGSDFLDFRLVDELGRGAFGRVFLAEQKGLANRYVALKVSTQLFDESQTLAQLQHTNIVPIYSVHQHGPLQAVCMPYFGSLTLADVLRGLEGRPDLPVSGNHLVSTLQNRRTTVRSLTASSLARSRTADQPAPAAEAAPAPTSLPGRPITDALSKLKQFGYVEAVLWVGGQLADALAHAHERGICHRDLKPANVLLTDEGQPMLLDFNLSDDQKTRRGTSAARIGGTLPYMAPEHLAAFRDKQNRPDARSDVYSLGLILFELLTGRHAFPNLSGSIHKVLPQLIEDRRLPVPKMRPWNPRVSPAVESIVRRCLEHDPDRRYQTASALREDVERHLAHLPLKHTPEPSLRERGRKFRRRHPLLTSSTSLLVLSTALILGLTSTLFAARQRYARLDALDTRTKSAEEMNQAKFLLYKLEPDRNQLQEGAARCRKFLETYPAVDPDALGRDQVLENPAWEQSPAVRHLAAADERKQLGEDVGEVLLMYVRAVGLEADQERDPAKKAARAEFGLRLADLAERHLDAEGKSRAAWLQRVHLTKTLGKEAEARDLAKKAEAMPLRTARDYYLAGLGHLDKRQFDKARPLFQEATRLSPQNFWTWFYLGLCHAEDRQHDEAAYCFTACLALAPQSRDAFYPYVNRGLVYLRQSRFRAAHDDLDRAVRLRPDAREAVVQRAVAARELAEAALRQKSRPEATRLFAAAERDLTTALKLEPNGTWVYFLRAAVRDKLGDAEGANQDRKEGLRVEPGDVTSWIDRGYARLEKDPAGALADFERALELNPRSVAALQNKAHVLAERQGKTEEAIRVLDKAVELYPGFVTARLGRGVLLARLGKRAEAIEDARKSLEISNQPPTFYQAANIYALTSKQNPEDRFQAFPLLSIALRGGFGLDIIDQDSDMDPIRNQPEFRRLVQAARQLQAK